MCRLASVLGASLAILGLVSASATVAQLQLPELSKPGDKGYNLAELIFSVEERPTPQCHASTIVETPTGLVAAWFGGAREGEADVGIWLSRHNGKKWSKPTEVAKGVRSSGERHPCWNPVLFLARNGPLMLFYKVGPSPSSWWGMLMTSKDGGATWSPPKELGEGSLGHLLGPVRSKPIQLAGGTLVCPSSTEHAGWRVHFELSSDLGKTWNLVGPINDGKEFGAIQPSFLTHGNGKLQVLCRTRQGVLSQSWSEDGGKTWSKMTATQLPNPNAGADTLTLSDGRHVLIYNHTHAKGSFPSGRNMINLAMSQDGINWQAILTLERSNAEFSYPALIQTADGRIHITYTFRRESIKHVVLDPRELDSKHK
jgi:predicted neuraminidase